MMKTLKVLFLISLCVFTLDTLAQEKQKSFFLKGKSKTAYVESVDSIKVVADSLHKELLRRDSIANTYVKQIDSLKKNFTRDSLMVVDINRHRDSLLGVIHIKDKEITALKANIGFVDTCMVKLANRWLYEKYDKVDVDEAIKYFDRIYSSKLKSELSIVQQLLRSYEASYIEFQAILKEAQRDYDRENPFACESYKNKYKHRIENMPYYIKYYNSGWNIRYLNAQIKEAIERLMSHSNTKFADFTSLIDMNF